jgi:hypothetical protein
MRLTPPAPASGTSGHLPRTIGSARCRTCRRHSTSPWDCRACAPSTRSTAPPQPVGPPSHVGRVLRRLGGGPGVRTRRPVLGSALALAGALRTPAHKQLRRAITKGAGAVDHIFAEDQKGGRRPTRKRATRWPDQHRTAPCSAPEHDRGPGVTLTHQAL